MKNWYTPQHGRLLKTLYQVIEANHERPHIVWLHLYEMSVIDKFRETETRSLVVGAGGVEGVNTNG